MDESVDLRQYITRLENEVSRYRRLLTGVQKRHLEYDAILDMLDDFGFVCRIEPDGRVMHEWSSSSVGRITGYSDEELAARNGWREFVHPADADRAREFEITALNGNEVSDRFRIVTRQGHERWVYFHLKPVRDEEHQRVTRLYGVGQDITDEIAVQSQQAQFITHAMHELSHPVSSVLMRLYLMRKQPEMLEEHLNALQPVAEHVRRLIEDMREVSYLDRHLVTLELREIPLQELLAEVVRIRQNDADQRKLAFELKFHPNPLVIRADVDLLIRAFSNLVSDVLYLTPPGQHIVIRIYPNLPVYAVCEIEHRREYVEHEHPSVAFHPFYRPSEGQVTHTGLELAITRSLLQVHGGDVDLTVDNENCGIFKVRLKLATPLGKLTG